MRRQALSPPRLPPSVPRRHFNPRDGWFRNLERQASRFLSRRVFPLLPGISLPYRWILDRDLVCSEAEIALDGLGSGLDRLSVLLITDIHAGPFLSRVALRRVLERVLSLRPDLILLGGDFATTNLRELEPHLPALSELRAPQGVWAVLGNHDHYTGGPDRLREMLGAAGIPVLHNDATCLERNGARILLAGIDDLHWGRPDLEGTLRRARALDGSAPLVLLSHNPDVFFSAAERGVRLVVAGHTHGGQIRVPGWPVLVRMSRFRLDEGRYAVGESELVVSRGVGVSGIPLRFACPPEVVRLTLRARPDHHRVAGR